MSGGGVTAGSRRPPGAAHAATSAADQAVDVWGSASPGHRESGTGGPWRRSPDRSSPPPAGCPVGAQRSSVRSTVDEEVKAMASERLAASTDAGSGVTGHGPVDHDLVDQPPLGPEPFGQCPAHRSARGNSTVAEAGGSETGEGRRQRVATPTPRGRGRRRRLPRPGRPPCPAPPPPTARRRGPAGRPVRRGGGRRRWTRYRPPRRRRRPPADGPPGSGPRCPRPGRRWR